MIERASGAISAAPAPWIARNAISCGSSTDSAHAAEPAVNTASPITNTRRRPNRSPSVPPTRISAASERT